MPALTYDCAYIFCCLQKIILILAFCFLILLYIEFLYEKMKNFAQKIAWQYLRILV